MITRIDFEQAAHGQALVGLLDYYAHDPMGGGVGLPAAVKASLPDQLRTRPNFVGWIGWIDGQAAGLMNCFEAFSTFRAQPLLNIHDIVVRAEFRRRGLAGALLAKAEQEARARNCCKLTLEVLEGNLGAIKIYRDAGFEPYSLDPKMGAAQLFQKKFYGE